MTRLMLIYLLSYLLISNALNLRKDQTILFSRIVMVSLILTSFLAFNNLFVLSLDKGYVFMALIANLTSIISAVYYLNVIKNLFFFKDEYQINFSIVNVSSHKGFEPINKEKVSKVSFYIESVVLSSALSIVLSTLTLILLFLIYIPNKWFSIANILTIITEQT